MQSMYVRIKRKKVTVFVHVEPTWTVLEIRQKVQELLQQVRVRRAGSSWPWLG